MASENGWQPAWVGQDSLEWVNIPGTNVTMQFRKGQPRQIMAAFAADYYTPTSGVAYKTWTA